MPNTYLPASGSGLKNWADNFAEQIAKDPPALGLTAEQVTAYTALQTDYAAKYAASVHPDTRGPASVLAKNIAKKALAAESRKLAMQVTNYPGVTDETRQALGLSVHDNEPTPVPVPETSPVIQIESVVGNRVTLRLRDADGSRRGRPPYVTGATVFSYVGEAAPGDISAWTFEGNIKDTVTVIDVPSTVAPGSKVFFTSFWRNNRDESGPATPPVSTNVQGGTVSKKAA